MVLDVNGSKFQFKANRKQFLHSLCKLSNIPDLQGEDVAYSLKSGSSSHIFNGGFIVAARVMTFASETRLQYILGINYVQS